MPEYQKGEKVKVKGRRGVHTVKTRLANGEGWWLVRPDKVRFTHASEEEMRRV